MNGNIEATPKTSKNVKNKGKHFDMSKNAEFLRIMLTENYPQDNKTTLTSETFQQ